MPRPTNEPRYSYGRTWIPGYTQLSIDYFDPKRLELFKLTQQLNEAELYGDYKYMKYEDALTQMKSFIDDNKLTIPPNAEFFISELAKIQYIPVTLSEKVTPSKEVTSSNKVTTSGAEKFGGRKTRNKKRRSKKYKKRLSKKI